MPANDHSRYISITMEFRCNLKCTHCMIENTMDWLNPISDGEFDSILEEQRDTDRWDGIILTGSEITLRSDLPVLASRAKNAGFNHIRIQTHGMHLSRPGYLKTLMDAGIDEFFVSVAGHNASLHDSITKVPRSFDRMIDGLKKIEMSERPAKIITNTVVTRESFEFLPDIVKLLSSFKKVVQHEFWNFFPMDSVDKKSLLVDYPTLMPFIHAAIKECQRWNRSVEVKNIPECLLGEARYTLVNEQPNLLIDPEFWVEFDKNGFHNCAFQSTCKSTGCLGLTEAYIKKYGWEKKILNPF